MKKYQITADPEAEVGVAIGQSFIAFECVHDVCVSPITKKRRYLINLSPDDMLWTIEALAKELPEVLRDEAIDRINELSRKDHEA